MEYFTADTYKNWERIGKPFDKNGKLYTKIKTPCSRCGGTGYYAIGVENGQLKLHPAYNGICLQCNQLGYIEKEVRLYTESEYKKMVATNEANRIKREAEKEAKMKAEYEEKRAEWLSKEEFSPEGVTYIVLGDSYSIKDELKKAGFRYSEILKWHRSTPGDYECLKVSIDEVADGSAWGTYNYRSSAKKYIADKIESLTEIPETEWYGEIKDKIVDMEVEVKSIRNFESRYGISHVYTFVAGTYLFTWFTSTIQNFDEGDTILLTGTVKEHTEYKNLHQTLLTRCKCVLA